MADELDLLLDEELDLAGEDDGDEYDDYEDVGYVATEMPEIGARRRRRSAKAHRLMKARAARLKESNVDERNLPRLVAGIPTKVIPANSSERVTMKVTNPFRPDRLVLSPAAQQLLVENIKIGRESLNAGDGPIPGSSFSQDSVDVNLRAKTAQVGTGVEILVSNPGSTDITFSGAFWGPAAS